MGNMITKITMNKQKTFKVLRFCDLKKGEVFVWKQSDCNDPKMDLEDNQRAVGVKINDKTWFSLHTLVYFDVSPNENDKVFVLSIDEIIISPVLE